MLCDRNTKSKGSMVQRWPTDCVRGTIHNNSELKILFLLVYVVRTNCAMNATLPEIFNMNAVASSVDPDQTAHEEQSDQGLQCLPFCKTI